MGAEKFRRLPFLSLPPGGKVAPKGPDEGAGFGLHLLYAGRLRAASFFPSDGKETKGSPGDGSGWTLRVHIRPSLSPLAFGHLPLTRGVSPRTPVTGVTPCSGQNISGAQNQECLGAVPSGPTGGLSGREIGAAAVPHLHLSLPSQRSQPDSRRRGGLWPPESLPL